MTHLTRSGPGPAPSVAAESLRDRVRIPPVPAAVRHARQWAAAVLARAKPPVSGDLLDASVLVVSELVTNAISAVGQDRRPPGRAEVWLAICLAGRRVRIEVHDSACSPLPPPRPGGGLGLEGRPARQGRLVRAGRPVSAPAASSSRAAAMAGRPGQAGRRGAVRLPAARPAGSGYIQSAWRGQASSVSTTSGGPCASAEVYRPR